jgi:N-acyl-D-amino-acid deacylase
VPTLVAFDKVMQDFMDTNGISAGQLAIMRNGVVIFDRSYGWQDKDRTRPLLLGAPMRVASVSKPITAAAIRELIRLSQGKLTLKTRVFSLHPGDGGILNLEPHPKGAKPDPRLKYITIEDCLRHRGGWDRKKAGDLTRRDLKIAKALGIVSPPGDINTVRYIMGRKLQYHPGNPPNNKDVYSNIGYLVLGLVIKKAIADEKRLPIEKITDDDYLEFLRKNVTRPAGIEDSEFILGRSLPADAHPSEPYYYRPDKLDPDRPQMLPHVFDSDPKTVELVEAPYGSFDMEARNGQGRIVTNARSLVKFLDKFVVSGDHIGEVRQPPYKKRNHTGRLPGTTALARARGDGINYAVIFNKDSADKEDDGDKDYAAQIRWQLDKLVDSGVIKWP